MKRDMDLVRTILLKLESRTFEEEFSLLEIKEFTENEIMYHIKLLYDDGLIEAVDQSASNDIYYLPGGLTSEGHEFIDLTRSETFWNKAKKMIAKQGKELTIIALKLQLQELIANS